jgi:hypothetical protein
MQKNKSKPYEHGELINHEGRTAIKVGENRYLNFYGIGFDYVDAKKIAAHFCQKVTDRTK